VINPTEFWTLSYKYTRSFWQGWSLVQSPRNTIQLKT
jgi:hypothetical protein